MTEGKMLGWHHKFNGHELEQTPENSEEQGSPVCCSPWGRKVRHGSATNSMSRCSLAMM